MEIKTMPGSWKAVSEGDSWQIKDKDNRAIASVEKGESAEYNARLLMTSPYMLEALKGLVALIGDDDLDDNGELSGAAICDMAREAIALALGIDEWDWRSHLE